MTAVDLARGHRLGVTVRDDLAGAATIALPVHPAKRGSASVIGAGADFLPTVGLNANDLVAAKQVSSTAGDVTVIPVANPSIESVAFVGVGTSSDAELRKAAASLARACKSSRSIATTLASGAEPGALGVIAEALVLASYRFTARQRPQKGHWLTRAALVVEKPAAARSELRAALRTAEAVCVARDLAMMPSDVKTPEWLATQARERGEAAGLTVRTWAPAELARDKFGGILAVGAGSANPPRLVQMAWTPSEPRRHIVLIGKGITFDSGGLSLKPADSMPGMKTDMAGGAAVIATMLAVPDLDLDVAVTALVPMAENMPGRAATRPGDVIQHFGGRTSEVLNTDAEGRLVLADTLAYAVTNLAPDIVVDLATLTGAASLGLGKRHGALYATSPALAAELLAAATAAGERLWQLPLEKDYRDALDSPIADLRNIGDPDLHYSGGSIVAALFLHEFVGDVPWAHLDIAGPARADADEVEVTKGATGFGVRTMLRWLSCL